MESGQSFTNAFQVNYGLRERVLTENIFMLHVIKAANTKCLCLQIAGYRGQEEARWCGLCLSERGRERGHTGEGVSGAAKQ